MFSFLLLLFGLIQKVTKKIKTQDFLGIITASLIPRITTRPTSSASNSNASFKSIAS